MTAFAKQADQFTAAEIDEEIVVMRLDTGDFFSLSGTAAMIWRLIDGTRDRDAIIGALVSEFGDPARRDIERDVDDFLNQIKQLGFIASV